MVTLNYQVSERWERKKKCLLLLHYDKNPVIACDVFEYRTRYNPLLKEYQFALPFAGKQRVTAFVAQFEKELRELSEQLTREIDARTARYNDSAYLAELKSAYLQKHPAVNSLPPRRRAKKLRSVIFNALGREDIKAARRLRMIIRPLLRAATAVKAF